MHRPALSLTALTLALAASLASAKPPIVPPATATATPPQPWNFQWRYRHEAVDDAGFAHSAAADTLRLRVGFNHAFGEGWSGLVEAEGVVELNDNFNSGANGQIRYPIVPDARALEINQAFVDWRGGAFGTRLGRQAIVLDNARFIGNVAWRQNIQTYDAAQFQWTPGAKFDLQAFWLGRVHRVNGDNARDPLARERELDARLLRSQWSVPNGSLVGYGYWIEDRDVATASTRSLGLRYAAAWPINAQWRFGLSTEVAHQAAYARASGGDTSYALFESRLERGTLVLRAGFERLGAGNGRAFQTPLATLHNFNGWADKFLITPIHGLEDRYISAQGSFTVAGKAATWLVRRHDFRSDHGTDYGQELNASLGLSLRPGLSTLVKLADYRSDGFARDTRKAWFQIEWSH